MLTRLRAFIQQPGYTFFECKAGWLVCGLEASMDNREPSFPEQ